MPRKAREKSPFNIYHIMLRGINKQQIFYDEQDYRSFEFLLSRYKEQCEYELLAYCLMGNHVHLLIKENGEPIGNIFKHIGCSFVYWHNQKYERTGHLFQDRFKSEPINNAAQLLTVLRYILNNPVKAGICNRPEEYRYSSAREYLLDKRGITDREMIRSFTDDRALKEFILRENDDQCMDISDNKKFRCDDESANRLILRELGTRSPVVETKDKREKLNHSICKLVNFGLSVRQLSRLSGIPKKIIENALKQ